MPYGMRTSNVEAKHSPSTVGADERYTGLIELGKVPSIREYLRAMWERRDFAITVPLNELRAQNQNTVLGNLWHLLNPLFLASVYFVIFGVILGARGRVENYPAFLVIGIFVFYFSQKAAMSGTRTIVSNIKLIQSLTFPRAILPLSSTIGETIAQFPAILAMFTIVVITDVQPTLWWALTVPLLLLQAVFNLGFAFVVARLTFHFRDVQQLLPYLLRMWLYLSGVFFAADFVPEGLPRRIFMANPLYQFIHLNRLALLERTTDLGMWLTVGAWSFGLFILGFLFFRAHETEYGRG